MVERRVYLTSMKIILIIAGIKLLAHFLTNTVYGFHRDEFLYVALGRHMDWGFLEVPPLTPLIAWLTEILFGSSLFAVRLFPALAGAAMVIFTGLIARELGGNRFAQFLAAFCVLVSVAYLRVSTLFTPDGFNQTFWVAGAWLLLRALKTNEPKQWIWFGVVCGLGLLNKYTMLLFGFSVLVGLIFTRKRQVLLTRWPWISAGIALLIFFPNLVWQHRMGWPFFQHMEALSETQLVNVGTAGFLFMQILMNMFTAPIWLVGLVYSFRNKEDRTFRVLGWLYVVSLLVLLRFGGKAYYLLPAYPMLFALGAVVFERFYQGTVKKWIMPVYLSLVILGLIVFLPYGLPVMPVDSLQSYVQFMGRHGFSELLRWEDGRLHNLPQEFADMFGWEEQVMAVEEIYSNLSQSDKDRCIIIAGSYGEAGAIDYYSDKYNLPGAISVSSSYYIWGYEDASADVALTIGIGEEALNRYFGSVELKKVITHNIAREDSIPLFVCRDPVETLEQLWPTFKEFRF